MAVFSNQVKEGLINYFNALLSYPISKERAKEKFTNLVNALNGLDNGIVKIRCKWKDLGQKYDKNGRMLIPDLYQYVWKDEADRPWSFSYVLDTNGIAHILIMKYSHFVKENNQNKTYKEMSRIRLTESQLHNVIRKCVNECIHNSKRASKLYESSILDNICLQVSPEHYGEFWLRDTESWLEFEADVWIENGMLMIDVSPEKNDRRAYQLCNSKEFEQLCLSAIFSDSPDNIRGFQEFVDEIGDYDEALEDLSQQIEYEADTIEKKNARIKRNMKASSPDIYSAKLGW